MTSRSSASVAIVMHSEMLLLRVLVAWSVPFRSCMTERGTQASCWGTPLWADRPLGLYQPQSRLTVHKHRKSTSLEYTYVTGIWEKDLEERCVYYFVLETDFHYAVLAGLKLTAILPLPPECLETCATTPSLQTAFKTYKWNIFSRAAFTLPLNDHSLTVEKKHLILSIKSTMISSFKTFKDFTFSCSKDGIHVKSKA